MPHTTEQKLKLIEKRFSKKSKPKNMTVKQVFKCSPSCNKCKACKAKHKRKK